MRHFAIGGLHGTSTEAIAREAGISQPYLFLRKKKRKDLATRHLCRAAGTVPMGESSLVPSFKEELLSCSLAGGSDRLPAKDRRP